MAIAPVVIEFLAKGVPQVQQAFKSIQDSAIRAEKAQVNAAHQAEKAIDRTGKTAARAAKTSISAAQAEARARIASTKAAERDLDRYQKKAQSDAKQTSKVVISAAQQEARARIQATKDAERDLDRWQKKAQQQRKQELREEQAAARERKSLASEQAHERNRVNRVRGRLAEAVVGAGARGVISGLQRAGGIATGLATTTAQLGGGFSIADSVEKRLGAHRLAANIASSTISEKVSTDDILKAAKPVSIATGMGLEEAVSGVDAFRKISGQTTRGMRILPELAKISTVFGADLGDIAKNAGGMAMSGKLSDEDITRMIRVQAYQGSVGAVELPDFAKYGQRITTAARDFSGDRTNNIGAVGAAAQIAMQSGSATTSSEATLAALRFTEDLAKKHKKLEKLGVTTVKDGRLRSLSDITAEMMAKTHGDVDKITDLGIGERGNKFLKGVAAVYRDEGQTGLDRQWDMFTGKKVDPKTGQKVEALSDDEINKRFGERAAEADKKLEIAFNELRVQAGEQLLPVFIQMIEPMKQLIPALVDAAQVGIPAFAELMRTVAEFVKANKGLIQDLAAHPIGTLIAFELTKSFATAGLPALLRALITGAFTGAGPAAAGGGVMKALGASVGSTTAAGLGIAAAAGVAAGAVTGGVIYKSGTDYADGAMNADNLAARVDAYGRGDTERGLSPEYASQQLAAAKARLGKTGAFDQIGNLIASPFVDSADQNYKQYKQDQALVDHENLKKAIADATVAGVQQGMAVGFRGAAANNSGPAGAGRTQSQLER